MASLNFRFTEPTPSNDDLTEINDKVIDSIKKFDIIMIKDRPTQIVEIAHSNIRIHRYHLLGIDIFTDHRYEAVFVNGKMVEIPYLSKKDYLLVSIDDDDYVSLLDEDSCNTRSDLKLKTKSDLRRQLIDKYNEGNDQITVTVVKAFGEEAIMEFKIVDN